VSWKERVPPRAACPCPARPWGILLSFGLIWGLLFRILALYWLTDTEYGYGWLGPVFGLYAGFRRWKTRPEPGAPLGLGYWLVAIAALAFLPTWLVVQPNPDWRMLSWILSAEVVAMTLGAVALAGGWTWMRHFAFPICLIFAAVPWPMPVEIRVVDGLMRGVTELTVAALNTAGVTALAHGNVIEVKTGLLGVEEACSGIRSLQAALMASLFLGELFRFGWRRRAGLVVAALIAALCANVGRTFFLGWCAANSGIGAMDRWHDPAGFAVLALCFLVLWGTALLLSRRDAPLKPAQGVAPAHALDGRFVVGIGAWFATVFIGTEVWYYDGGKPPESRWSLSPPAYAQPWTISDEAAEQLQADRTLAAAWNEPDGGNWRLLYFEWKPGPMRSRVLAKLHRPDICLSETGLRLLEDRGTVAAGARGITLLFHAYVFEEEGHSVYVYYGVWENRSARGLEHGPLSETVKDASLEAVLWRERNLGQQEAELAASGYPSVEAADGALERVIREVLVPRTEKL